MRSVPAGCRGAKQPFPDEWERLSIGDEAALPWVQQFLDDRNRGIRWNGLAVLRTILCGPLGDAAIASAMQLLDQAEQDSEADMRERAQLIRSEFKSQYPYIKLPQPTRNWVD